jgi:hypothetical protein
MTKSPILKLNFHFCHSQIKSHHGKSLPSVWYELGLGHLGKITSSKTTIKCHSNSKNSGMNRKKKQIKQLKKQNKKSHESRDI